MLMPSLSNKNINTDSFNINNLKKLLLHTSIKYKKIKKNQKYYGKVFVITGSFEVYSRSEIKEYLKNNGAKVTSSVSKKTDYLIVGKLPGRKLAIAKDLGVQIITSQTLEDIMSH